MPKKDSITGCSVMTMPEFWQAEAKHEGKGRSGFDLMQDMHQDIANEDARMEKDMRENPSIALNAIKEYFTFDEEDCIDYYGFTNNDIVSIEVINVSVSTGIRKSTTSFEAKIVLVDHTTRTVRHTLEDFYDSSEPPSSETNLVIIAINDKPVIASYCGNCASKDEWEKGSNIRIPMCEVCEHFGGGAVHNKLNSARYLCPASTDHGKTVSRWVRVCVAHIGYWYKGAGWFGPVIKLKQEAIKMPYVRGFHYYNPH